MNQKKSLGINDDIDDDDDNDDDVDDLQNLRAVNSNMAVASSYNKIHLYYITLCTISFKN